jgi:hypothetical protein
MSNPKYCSHISATHNVQNCHDPYLQSHYTEATERCAMEWLEWWYSRTDTRKIAAAEKRTLELDVIWQSIIKERMDDYQDDDEEEEEDCMNS